MKRLALAGTLLVAMAGTLAAAPTIGTVAATPLSIVAGTPTVVLFTAVINDPAFLPNSVTLIQRDTAGNLSAVLGTLHDDGLAGDAVANDQTFSLRLTLTFQTPGTVVFYVTAALGGSPLRAPSAGLNGTVGPNGGDQGSSGPISLSIVSPSNLSFLNISPTTVSGTADGSIATVNINDLTAPVVNGRFALAVPLREGPNTITATGTTGTGTVATANVTATLDTTPPHLAITQPPDQFVTSDSTVTVTGIVNDIVVGTVNDQQATVVVNGVTAAVANRTFLAPGIPLALGTNVIQAIARDRVGNSITITINVIRQAPADKQVTLTSGNNQTAPIHTQVAQPLVVTLTSGGSPAAGIPVVFRVAQNDGVVRAGAGTAAPSVVATTDAQGHAQVSWTLGNRAGAGGNSVEATSAGFAGTAIFIGTGTQGAAAGIVVDSGNDQIGVAGQSIAKAMIAVVIDSGANRLANVPVRFDVTAGGGNINGLSSYTVNSDSDGRVAATLVLGPSAGNSNNSVSASFTGNLGTPAVFRASGRIAGSAANTSVSGVVLDNTNTPLPGVTVRVVSNNLLTSNASIINTIPGVQTNAQGQFTISPAPVGLIKLLVDGSTASVPGNYPTLDYEFFTVPGQNNTIGQPIYLVALSNNRLCVTATSGGGTLTMPEAPGFSLTFGPGQVTFPGGSQSGCISVTLVHADRMPMQPGFGQQPRFLITIQPPGAIFNPPAPISMPNVDGLPPHAVTEMYSFDHDINAFVAIGTGTVSADGLAIVSNPGVGVLKAGWHCGGNPAASGGAQSVDVVINTPGPVQLDINGTASISSTGTPSPGTYSWSSSSPGVAQIVGGADGASVTVKGIAQGTATLTVTYTCESGASASASISVKVGLSISITDTQPPTFSLGSDGVITYRVDPPGGSFDSVALEIRNGAGTLVYKLAGLATSGGSHTAIWTGIKWNQGSNAGAFANPKNGPYEVKVIGTKGGTDFTDTRGVPLKLVIEADIKDEKPAGSAVSRTAGLEGMLSALKIVMKLGAAETVVSGAGSIVSTGPADNKHIVVATAALNNLADGTYEVLFRDLRDDIGNFADTDNNAANGITPPSFNITIK